MQGLFAILQLLRMEKNESPVKMRPAFRKYGVNDFKYLKVLGKGSFGKVLLSELKDSDHSFYAIKCLRKDLVLEDDDIECTMIERKVLALGIKHPFLCHLFCTFQTNVSLFVDRRGRKQEVERSPSLPSLPLLPIFLLK